MKKTVFWVLLTVAVIFGMGFSTGSEIGARVTVQDKWQAVCTAAAAGDEPIDLAADERTLAAVQAAILANESGQGKITVFNVPRTSNYARLRCMGSVNNDDAVFNVYSGMKETGDLTLRGQLAFVTGTQEAAAAGYYYADTVVISADSGDGVVGYNHEDRIAEVRFDLLGDNFVVIVPVTLDGDATLLYKGY